MKALVINKPGELQVKDLATPAIGADEVLVRMRAVGICHSDYELYSGKYIIPIDYPVIPGHEWSGEVVETGKAVSGLERGDRVVGECVIESGEEVDHFGFSIDGAYSQLFRARPEWLHKLPEGVSFARQATIGSRLVCKSISSRTGLFGHEQDGIPTTHGTGSDSFRAPKPPTRLPALLRSADALRTSFYLHSGNTFVL